MLACHFPIFLLLAMLVLSDCSHNPHLVALLIFCFHQQTNMDDVIMLNHLGPHNVKEVDDDVLRAARFGVPVVIQQPLDNGVMACAVLADRDVKMACLGCFQRTMRISDTTRCKKCSSYVKHHDFEGGVRRLQCKEGGDAKDIQPVKAVTITTATKVEGLTDNELLDAVKSRQLGSCVVDGLCDEDLASAMRARGVEPLIDARPARLIHELRRQGNKSSNFRLPPPSRTLSTHTSTLFLGLTPSFFLTLTPRTTQTLCLLHAIMFAL